MSKHSGGNPYPRPLSSLTPAIHGLVSGAVIGALLGLPVTSPNPLAKTRELRSPYRHRAKLRAESHLLNGRGAIERN